MYMGPLTAMISITLLTFMRMADPLYPLRYGVLYARKYSTAKPGLYGHARLRSLTALHALDFC